MMCEQLMLIERESGAVKHWGMLCHERNSPIGYLI